MSKFKVGDRVEKRNGKHFSSGYSVHTVDSIEGDKIWFVESRTCLSSKFLQLVFGHPEDTSKYHKHHDLIIQWAKGAEIEKERAVRDLEQQAKGVDNFADAHLMGVSLEDAINYCDFLYGQIKALKEQE